MRIKNKKIDEFFKKLPVSKNYETKIILNRAFLQKEKEQYGVYCSFEIKDILFIINKICHYKYLFIIFQLQF
jgi:hypothetical protein